MKLSEYHKAHGLSGTLRSLDTNTELHFSFEKGKNRTGVELQAGGLTVEGYLEVVPLNIRDPHHELDLGLRLVLGSRPAEDYQPDPKAVAGNRGPVDVPKVPTFEPIAPPEGLTARPVANAVRAEVLVVGGFDPGPRPPSEDDGKGKGEDAPSPPPAEATQAPAQRGESARVATPKVDGKKGPRRGR